MDTLVSDRIKLDEFGLDELVVSDCMVYIERMHAKQIRIGISKGNKYVAMFLNCPKGALRVTESEGFKSFFEANTDGQP